MTSQQPRRASGLMPFFELVVRTIMWGPAAHTARTDLQMNEAIK